MTDTMRAAVRSTYGLDAIEVREVPKPDLVDDGVLVRVSATSVNPAEWHAATGIPYIARPQMGLFRPSTELLGGDFSGIVETVGPDIAHVSPGDEVFGGRAGAFAEFVCVRNAVTLKPDTISHEEAAAVGTAAITALQALRDHGHLQPGQSVLINGASGGVGTYAVQIGKAMGGEVTAVCSTGKVDIARSLGADHVIDYTQTDFTRTASRCDLVIDIAGSRRWGELRRVLNSEATVVIVGGPKGGRLLGPLTTIVGMKIGSRFRGQTCSFFLANLNRPDMEYLADLIQTGRMRSVIDKQYNGLEQIPDALRYLREGHARGKIVVSV